MMLHSTRRALVKAERERIIRSRKIVVLGDGYSYVFVGALWLLVSWLSVKSTQVFLFLVSFQLHSFVEVVIGQVLSLWTLHSLTGSLGRSVFHVDAEESSWYLVKCCVESIYRAWTDYRGMPDPYNTELTRLRSEVREQYAIWKFRITKMDFYTALKRKRITNRECVLLLTEFAHTYIEKDGEEIVEGELPVKLSEAEEFLKLRVDGQEPCTEISLDADQALKNYLSRGQKGGGSTLSIEGIHDLSKKIYSCVEFSEGDRVMVRDEDYDSYEEDDDCSDEGLGQSSALVSRRSKTGSVVFSTATLCFIHFDGEAATTPTPISINLCSKLDEMPIEEKKKESLPAVTDDESEDDGYVVSTTGSKTEKEEEERDTVVASKPQKKARTVEEALIEGGWKLERSKNHLIYSRRVKIQESETRKQNVAMAKTPSDGRATKNALALLRKLNEVLHEDEDADNSGEISECKECLKEKSNRNFSKTQLKKAENNRKCNACCGN